MGKKSVSELTDFTVFSHTSRQRPPRAKLEQPEMLLKALSLLVNLLYIFIYAYAPLP